MEMLEFCRHTHPFRALISYPDFHGNLTLKRRRSWFKILSARVLRSLVVPDIQNQFGSCAVRLSKSSKIKFDGFPLKFTENTLTATASDCKDENAFLPLLKAGQN